MRRYVTRRTRDLAHTRNVATVTAFVICFFLVMHVVAAHTIGTVAAVLIVVALGAGTVAVTTHLSLRRTMAIKQSPGTGR